MNNSARQQSARFDETEPTDVADPEAAPSDHGHGPTPAKARVTDFPARKTDAEAAAAGSRQEIAPDDKEKGSMWKWISLALAIIVVGVVAWVVMREPAAPSAAANPANTPLELAAVDVATIEPRVLTRLLPLSGSIRRSCRRL